MPRPVPKRNLDTEADTTSVHEGISKLQNKP
jgi:hypothetical protein